MKRFSSNTTAQVSIVVFFVLILGIAFLCNPYYPVLVIAGESSVGTWMSGVLLVISATLMLVFGVQNGLMPWIPLSMFFFLLSVDERFMFHEALKERLLFILPAPWLWVVQLPVILGSLIGFFLVLFLSKKILSSRRVWLYMVLLFGGASVVFDIMEAGVFLEEVFKLAGELLFVLLLVGEVRSSLK